MATLDSVPVTCPACQTAVPCPATTTGVRGADAGVSIDPLPIAAHLVDCLAPQLGGTDLLTRLSAAADRLEQLGHTDGLHDDLRAAITRIRLAELAAAWALGRREALRPPTTEVPHAD